jgi:hypothetical protein
VWCGISGCGVVLVGVMLVVWVGCRLRMDMYAKTEESESTKKPWTEQEVLLLLEVCLQLGSVV